MSLDIFIEIEMIFFFLMHVKEDLLYDLYSSTYVTSCRFILL